MASIIIDVVLALIVVLFVWRGYKNGFIVSIIGVVAIIIAFAGANIVSRTFSQEFAGMLEPFVGGVVDKAVSSTLNGDRNLEGEEIRFASDASDTSDIYIITYNSLRSIGISDSASDKLADTVSGHFDRGETKLSVSLTEYLCSKLAFVLVFAVTFILLAIIFAAIGNVINLAFKLPGLETLNKVLGAVFGFAKGCMILLFIACIFRYLGMVLPDNFTDDTILLKWLIDANPLANIIGI